MAEQFQADLNIIQSAPIELELLDGNLNVIQQLDDEPNDVGGLTSAQLKAKFDQAGNMIKQYINETLIPAILASDATEANRTETEAARVTAESGRATAEAARAEAETGRSGAEASRVNAENGRAGAEQARVTAEAARNVWALWDAAETYQPTQKVSRLGSSYVCTAANVGVDPGTDAPPDAPEGSYWTMIAAKGDKGDTGATGAQGPKGETGDVGPRGLQGEKGNTGDTGPQGPKGDMGVGIPTGGTAGQFLVKNSATNYDIKWVTVVNGNEVNY